METDDKKKLYIVSFGDSRQYRMEAEEVGTPLLEIENKLNTMLQTKFPGDTFAYFTTPKVVEISWEHRDRYAEYPELDGKAVADIEEVLVKEVEERNALRELDSDAPYADINGVGVLNEV